MTKFVKYILTGTKDSFNERSTQYISQNVPIIDSF